MSEPAARSRHRAWRDHALALAVVVVAGGLAHGRETVQNLSRHHWEDWRFFRHNRTQVHSPLDCFTKPSVWPGLYRPLSTNCYYLLGRKTWANRIEVYHAVNAGLFLLNGLLLFAVARRLLPLPLALVAVALWTSRVSHRQLLLYSSEFQGLFSTLLSLLAVRLALSAREPHELAAAAGAGRREALGLAAFAGALLSKESSVAVPAMVTAYSLLMGKPRWWWRDGPWWGLAALWAVLFALVLRGLSANQPTGYSYDLSWAILTRYAAYALMFFNSIVLPVDDWAAPARVPALAGSVWVLAPMAVALASLCVASIILARERSGTPPAAAPLRVMAFGLAWFVMATAPFVVFEDRLFLRYAYFGHAGLALMVAALPLAVSEMLRRPRRVRPAQPPAAMA